VSDDRTDETAGGDRGVDLASPSSISSQLGLFEERDLTDFEDEEFERSEIPPSMELGLELLRSFEKSLFPGDFGRGGL